MFYFGKTAFSLLRKKETISKKYLVFLDEFVFQHYQAERLHSAVVRLLF